MNAENMPKIIERMSWTPQQAEGYIGYTTSNRPNYFVTAYVSKSGKFYSFAILPHYLLDEFEYDPVKIKTDWDQIVRK